MREVSLSVLSDEPVRRNGCVGWGPTRSVLTKSEWIEIVVKSFLVCKSAS